MKLSSKSALLGMPSNTHWLLLANYAAFIDVASAIDWYLVNEFSKNVDSNFFSSDWLEKPRGEKLFFGPIWDFDLAMGNGNILGAENPHGWQSRQAA